MNTKKANFKSFLGSYVWEGGPLTSLVGDGEEFASPYSEAALPGVSASKGPGSWEELTTYVDFSSLSLRPHTKQFKSFVLSFQEETRKWNCKSHGPAICFLVPFNTALRESQGLQGNCI